MSIKYVAAQVSETLILGLLDPHVFADNFRMTIKWERDLVLY
jgi:hypothetical protein